MNIYTVSFFGHRKIENPSEIEKRLDSLLHDIITQKDYVEFLIGREGEFDLLAASVIKRAVKSYGCGNTSLILVLGAVNCCELRSSRSAEDTSSPVQTYVNQFAVAGRNKRPRCG